MASSTRVLSAPPGRRSFLAQLGVMGSALAGVSAFGRSAPGPLASFSPIHMEGRVGLLMPSATLCRGQDEHLFSGFQLALEQARQQGGDIRVELLRATSALSPSAYRKSAESLLQKGHADLVIALAQPGVVATVAPAFEDASRCLVVVDGGANIVRTGDLGRYVFYNTLGHWESCWALGQWAAKNFRGPGFLVSSGFEAGHDGLRAFRGGVDSVGGPEAQLFFPRMPLAEAPSGRSMELLVAEIGSASPAFVVAFLNGRDGAEFLKTYALAGLTERIPLLGSSFLAEEAVAQGYGRSAAGLYSASTWSSGLATAENRAFLAAYQHRYGREANAFALLGFDTAQMLMGASTASGGQARIPREYLEAATWKSPRGAFAMDSQTHTSSGGMQLNVLRLQGGALQNAMIEPLPVIRTNDMQAVLLRSKARGSVLNPYPIY